MRRLRHDQRVALTEIGPDRQARREEIVKTSCPISASARCRRISVSELAITGLAARLREHGGRSPFEPGNPAMAMILSANPNRARAQPARRIEVYQPIPPPSGKPGGAAHACAAAAPAQQADRPRHRTGA